jgi:methyltransferase (TIGR00027 family)
MQQGTPSRTAAWVAVMRGLGRYLPGKLLLAQDPYGTAFGGQQLRWMSELTPEGAGRIVVGLPGVRSWVLYMQVRTRVLDDVVRTYVREGGRQLVLLGAGYDSRALRMPELQEVAVFEIDHPATQQHKQEVLAKIGARSPSRYVSWDFESRPTALLPQALEELGHDSTQPTLTLWEGVTMYLTERALDASMRAVADYSAPGSRLAMTYHTRDASRGNRIADSSEASGRGPISGASGMIVSKVVDNLGEPFRWAWPPGSLPSWVASRGFTVESELSWDDAARALLPAELFPSSGPGWPGASAVLRR